MKKKCQFAAMGLAFMLLPVSATPEPEKSKSAAAFEQLSSLVGEWKGVQEETGAEITLTYSLTAGRSTLMEESKPASGGVMLTMFFAGGDHLLATHYCSAWNQPHMASKTIVDPQRKAWASLGDQANVFGRFVGTWDVDYGEFSEDGKVTRFPGELIVGWILDGHALQDLFINDPTTPGKEREIGTTLRYFDNKSGKWRAIYVEPPTAQL